MSGFLRRTSDRLPAFFIKANYPGGGIINDEYPSGKG